MAAALGASYPARTMEGSRREPMAEASAMEDPEIPEKKISRRPRQIPAALDVADQVRAKRTRRWEIPLLHQSPGQDEKRYGQNGKVSCRNKALR